MGWREAVVALVSRDSSATTPAGTDVERGTYWAPPASMVQGAGLVPTVTTSTAAQSVAVGTTQDLIRSLTSELPVDVYEGHGRGRKHLSTPGNIEDPAGDGYGREDWGYRLLGCWVGPGNAFGNVIERDPRTARATHIDVFDPDQVDVTIVEGSPTWTVNGKPIKVPANFQHWRVFPSAGKLLGLSPIANHAATIGVSLAATRFGRAFFAEGMHAPGVLSHEGEIGEDGLEIAKRRALAVMGTREPLTLAGKWGWQSMQITPEESQFLETQGFSEAQCARIYGPGFAEILGYETGSKMTYANVVDRRQDLLVLSMGRWFRRYERALSLLLPDGQYVEINRDALLESTTLQRYQAHNLALSGKWKTPNEVREHENLAPVSWGNEPVNVSAAPAQPTKEGMPADGAAAGS